jgi:hypothetical protein
MDFSTIQKKMEGKDDNKYNNVREIYSDVRLIFANAMKYNDERHDVHIMAKSLLEKFEEKWLQLLPKVENEERKQKDEESNGVPKVNISPEEAIAKLAKDTDNEVCSSLTVICYFRHIDGSFNDHSFHKAKCNDLTAIQNMNCNTQASQKCVLLCFFFFGLSIKMCHYGFNS